MEKLNAYKRLCAEYYDLDKPEAPEEILHCYRNYVQKSRGPILEPLCGSGRILVPLLEEGHPIEGLDASPDMLEACLSRCREKSLSPVLYEQFLEEMKLPHRYGLIMIPCASFGMIWENESILNALKSIYNHLLPGGLFVFEVETLKAKPEMLNLWNGKIKERPDGSKILFSTLSDFEQSTKTLRIIRRYESLRDFSVEKMEVEDYRIRLYDFFEMDELLHQLNFTFKKYQVCNQMPASAEDKRIIYECTKSSP